MFVMYSSQYLFLQWDEDIEVSDITREYGDIEWLHHNIITQNNIDGIIVCTRELFLSLYGTCNSIKHVKVLLIYFLHYER